MVENDIVTLILVACVVINAGGAYVHHRRSLRMIREMQLSLNEQARRIVDLGGKP